MLTTDTRDTISHLSNVRHTIPNLIINRRMVIHNKMVTCKISGHFWCVIVSKLILQKYTSEFES